MWVKHALANRTKGRTGLTTAEREELVPLRKRHTLTTMSDHDQPVADNLLNRQFEAEAPNQRWVGDTTEFVIGSSGKLVDRFDSCYANNSMTSVPLRLSQNTLWPLCLCGQSLHGSVAEGYSARNVASGLRRRTSRLAPKPTIATSRAVPATPAPTSRHGNDHVTSMAQRLIA